MEELVFEQKGGRGTGAQSKSIRVLRMAWLLQQRDITVPELMRRFGVSRRTVYRDLKLIYAAGLPMKQGDEQQKTALPLAGVELPTWAMPQTFRRQ
ncbi:MAG: HTH domain-containing protein [Planctomycetes bacterium]|nr:HTH domain-containing protein [Planctomycetota bacterium]